MRLTAGEATGAPPRVPDGTIGDRVWNDLNADGIQDANELGLADIEVRLRDGTSLVVSTVLTDSNGNYGFAGMTAGPYSLEVVVPSGYFVTAKDQGTDYATDSDFDPFTAWTEQFVYDPAVTDLSIDAGLVAVPTGPPTVVMVRPATPSPRRSGRTPARSPSRARAT